MVFATKNADHPKKEKKKKRNSGKTGKGKPETSKAEVALAPAPAPAPVPPPVSAVARAQVDPVIKNLLLQKSKTLIDFRRKSKPETQDSSRLDWNQLSFRKRINQFIQNSPLLKRARQPASLKNDLNRLSDSLESLKIDENRVLITDLFRSPISDQKRKISRKTFSKSCNEFDLSRTSRQDWEGGHGRPDPQVGLTCWKCTKSDKTNLPEMKGGSLWNLSGLPDKMNVMKRSSSLQLTARPWSWMSVSSNPSLIFCIRLRNLEWENFSIHRFISKT